MPEWIERHPDLNVQEREYKRLLGFPHDFEFEGRSRELADQARDWYQHHGRPWIFLRTAGSFALNSGHVSVEGTELVSTELFSRLTAARSEGAAFAAVSAGPECEEHTRELWHEGKPDEYFFLEVYGSAVVEHLIAQSAFLLCEWADSAGKAVLPHYSPGYPGWNIADQQRLLSAARTAQGTRLPGDLQVMESGMLVPRKSLLALFGISPGSASAPRISEMIPCERCSLPNCTYRRIPYRHPMGQTEDPGRLQPSTSTSAVPQLQNSARYSVAQKTLDKWSRERLSLAHAADGSVTARFRYQGTTCSDLGRPLEFDYHVRLSAPAKGSKILEAHCEPAPDDSGHTFMCRYRDDGRSFIDEIRNDRPLVGRSLDAVFQWVRPYAPSGCYCETTARDHKWALVFEVLHYALTRPSTDTGNKQ